MEIPGKAPRRRRSGQRSGRHRLYFVYGPELDKVVAGYRRITGPAPMIPRWALGLWQSRQLTRRRKPASTLWTVSARVAFPSTTSCRTGSTGRRTWGSHEFDQDPFPIRMWVRKIHEKHARLMISVWGKSIRARRTSRPCAPRVLVRAQLE